MPLAIRSSATLPLTVRVRIASAAATAASAAGDEILHLRLGLEGDPLGLGLGASDDRRGLLLGFSLLFPILRQQGLRLLLQAARLVELRLDAIPALVDAFEDELVHLEIAEH